jgi:ketosteroid isomerase-like protein
MTNDQRGAALIHAGYAAFNCRDIEAALLAMTLDVEWANGWEGGYVHGHDGVRDYWSRQWQQLDPTVTPIDVVASEDQLVVLVDQTVRQPDGTELSAGTVRHVYTLRDGLIARMDIEPTETS